MSVHTAGGTSDGHRLKVRLINGLIYAYLLTLITLMLLQMKSRTIWYEERLTYTRVVKELKLGNISVCFVFIYSKNMKVSVELLIVLLIFWYFSGTFGDFRSWDNVCSPVDVAVSRHYHRSPSLRCLRRHTSKLLIYLITLLFVLHLSIFNFLFHVSVWRLCTAILFVATYLYVTSFHLHVV